LLDRRILKLALITYRMILFISELSLTIHTELRKEEFRVGRTQTVETELKRSGPFFPQSIVKGRQEWTKSDIMNMDWAFGQKESHI
jgi:hypothetical protein